MLITLIVSLSGPIAGGSIAYITGRSITRPVGNLTLVAEAISQGDMYRRAEETSSGEIGVLARVFNNMADKIYAPNTELELSMEELQAVCAAFASDVYDLTPLASATARDVGGGTAPSRVAAALVEAKARLTKPALPQRRGQVNG